MSWQMMKDGCLPDDLEVRKIGRIYYARSRSAVASSGICTVLYARMSCSRVEDQRPKPPSTQRFLCW